MLAFTTGIDQGQMNAIVFDKHQHWCDLSTQTAHCRVYLGLALSLIVAADAVNRQRMCYCESSSCPQQHQPVYHYDNYGNVRLN